MKRGTWIPAAALGLSIAALWFNACGDDPVEPVNRPPVLREIIVQPASVVPGGQARMTALANDPDNLPLSYLWTASAGTFSDPQTDPTFWTAPDSSGEYEIHLEVSDGVFSVAGSTSVTVGRVRLEVLSEIPGAGISLNGGFPLDVTPHVYDDLAPGVYGVEVVSDRWRYVPDNATLDLADGDSVTVEFTLADPVWEPLALGRTDVVEIGAVSFLASGTGFLYSARTTTGTGIFSAALNPPTGGANGVLVHAGVSVNEPVAITADGERIFFVSDDDSLFTLRIRDFTQNGVVDSVWDVRNLETIAAFGPSVSFTDDVAYSTAPSSEPPVSPLFRSQFVDSMLVGRNLASSTLGRLPSWEPGGSRIAYEWDGTIFSYSTAGGVRDTVTADGYNTVPAWGPLGPRPIAVVHGDSEANLTAIRIVYRGSPEYTTVASGLLDPRFLTWSPLQRALIYSVNPPGSGPAAWLLFNLPVP